MEPIIRYRVELWDGDAWCKVTHEYTYEIEARKRLNNLRIEDEDIEFRLVKCTYEVIG